MNQYWTITWKLVSTIDVAGTVTLLVLDTTFNPINPNWFRPPDAAALSRSETMSAGLGFPGPALTNPNSTIMLPEVTEIITMYFSLIPRTAARPDTNAARRAEPSPNSLIDPVSVIKTIGLS